MVGSHPDDKVEALIAAANLMLAHEGVAELHRVERRHVGRHLFCVFGVTRLEEVPGVGRIVVGDSLELGL